MKTEKKNNIIKTLVVALIVGFLVGVLALNSEATNADPETITLHTNQGDIELELFYDEVPKTSQNFLKLAKDGKYDGTIFHRVIPGFMIQGGDFENMNGTGGHAYGGGYIEDEFNDKFSHVRGMLSMANRGPNTNGSQFFIMDGDAPHLDGRHTIFGQVTKGMDVVDMIINTERDERDRPLKDMKIEKVTFQ